MIPGLSEQPVLPCDHIVASRCGDEVVIVGVQLCEGRAHVVASITLTRELAKELLLDLGAELADGERKRKEGR